MVVEVDCFSVQACVHRGSASLFALRNAAGERVTWLGLEFLNRADIFYLFIYLHLFPRQRLVGTSGADIELGWSCHPAPRLAEQRPVTSVRAAGTTTGTSSNKKFSVVHLDVCLGFIFGCCCKNKLRGKSYRYSIDAK